MTSRRRLVLVFIDVDGVLNGHRFDKRANSSTLLKRCVRALNYILDSEPRAVLVISSAWRYMVLNGAMGRRGFEYLLRTHGVHCDGRVLGITERDKKNGSIPDREGREQRAKQILSFVARKRRPRYVALDDLDLRPWIRTHQVRTDGHKGMSMEDARRALEILREG